MGSSMNENETQPTTFPGFTIDVISRLLPGKGHDAWHSSEHGAAVVDGATPMGPDYPDDLPAFAAAAAEELSEASFNDIQDLHTGAIQVIRTKFEPAGYKRTAATSVVRHEGDQLHCAVLGDCRILVGTISGVVDVFDSTLSKLEQAVLAAGLDRRVESARRRTRVFEEQLYRIFGDQLEAAIPKVGAVVSLHEVETIILMSDGAWNVLPQDPAAMLRGLTGGDLGTVFDAARTGPLTDDTTIIRLERIHGDQA